MTTKTTEQIRDELAEMQFNTKQHDSEMETTSKIMRGIFKLGFDAAVEHLKAEHQKISDAFCVRLIKQENEIQQLKLNLKTAVDALNKVANGNFAPNKSWATECAQDALSKIKNEGV